MEKAVAYLFGNDIIGSVKLRDDDSCILIEIDIKGVDNFGFSLSIEDNDEMYDLVILPSPCKRRIKLNFYSDMYDILGLYGKTIVLKSDHNEVLADGIVMQIIYGKRYYAEV